MNSYYVGLDLGQSRDFTALAIVERSESNGDWDAAAYAYPKAIGQDLRHLERLPLGTPYPEVVSRVVQVMESMAQKGPCELIVDATGVGRPVVDMLRAEQLDCAIRPVLVTAGQAESEDDGYYKVPKRDLIIGLQVLLQAGTLRIADGLRYGPTLINEMTEMQLKMTTAGNEQFAAWREGSHDDLVFAVALAGWGAERWCPRDMNGCRRLL
jgi:hypothetical protein